MDCQKLIVDKVASCLIEASSAYPNDKKHAYMRAIECEKNETAKWLLEIMLANGEAAEQNSSPLCDDTGIPHILLEVGPSKIVNGEILKAIELGVAEGLRRLPGRPMAVKGDGEDRLGQTLGMYDDPAMLDIAPVAIRRINEDIFRIHVLMLGGGPAIRGRSYRIFHRHDASNIENQIIEWAKEACLQLGCSPCTLAIGIGRSHYEAVNLMLQAQVDGRYGNQSEMEQRISDAVNASGIGPMGIGGSTTVLGTFLKIGPARASGVRIVCLRPCCCFEPRHASVVID
ncbi:fumarate hydratase [Adlercreutzia sp. ZJ304]|uniref:fumarate hydratase n=1 Tax=Adlercreutzia sp. ZJ304 TaxID=2709791 RepID=UPI0013ED6042|nr:fumarate hydratase [Adlercreutzia sp. ZJ304]